MRHRVAQRKLGMKSAHRQATLANLASALVMHDRIATTLPKAKELKRIADRVVTLSKTGTVHAFRRARIVLRNVEAVKKAFTDFKERFADRNGGYTRVLKLGFRHGDCAPMALIEYLPSAKMIESQKEEEAKRVAKGDKEKKKKVSLKERVLGKTKETKMRGPTEKYFEVKAPARRVPQRRAKKEA
jgi:large subunit ribosomal protein L17